MPPTKFGRRYEMPLDPHCKDPAPAEFLERLALLQAVAEDAQDIMVTLIGTGYSATVPEFNLAGYVDSLARQISNVKARAEQIYRPLP